MMPRHNISGKDLALPPFKRVALAFSGGGDSTALVHMLRRRTPRPVVLIVDHALRPGSRREAEAALEFAQTHGYDARILTWDHDNPVSGLQEKARKARYGLLGQACREMGIKYLVTAHTEDDQAETLLMRYDRKTDWRGAAGMADVTYAPLWPELAGVSICRPMLEISRAALRDYNTRHDLAWCEDPGNENLDFSRIRARKHLAARPKLRQHLLETARDLFRDKCAEYAQFRKELESWTFGWAGDVKCPHMPPNELLMMVLRCAAGQAGDINRKKLSALRRNWMRGDIDDFTMAGAKLSRLDRGLVIYRDPVAVTGRSDGNLAVQARPLRLTEDPQIWDGRFVVSAKAAGYSLRARHNLGLPRSGQLEREMKALPASARKTAPVIVFNDQACAVPEAADVTCKSLVRERLEATLDPHGTVFAQ